MDTKLLKLSSIGRAGINTDLPPWELRAEHITYGENFRILNSKIVPAGGKKEMLPVPYLWADGDVAGVINNIRVPTGDYWLLCTRKKVLATSSRRGWYDAGQFDYNLPIGLENEWVISQMGSVVVINNPASAPEYWAGLKFGLKFKLLPYDQDNTWEDMNLTCRTMRAHKNFLIAMNISGQSGDLPSGYMISHPAEENSIPYTWSTTDRSSLAQEGQLGGDGVEIVDGATLRDAFYMYSRDSIDVFTFNAGSEFPWSRREFSPSIGLISSNCLIEANGVHYFITQTDLMKNDGSQVVSITNDRIKNRFKARINADAFGSSYMTHQAEFNEIWFCIPEDESIVANTAFVYNWLNDSWSIRDIPEGVSYSDYGYDPLSIDEAESYGLWATSIEGWSSATRSWANIRSLELIRTLGGITTDGRLLSIDPLQGSDIPVNCVLERTDFPLDDLRQTNTITRIYPTADGDPFNIEIGSQEHAGGPVTWRPPVVFDPGKDRKIDVRSTGEMMAWRVSSIGNNSFSLSGMMIEYSNSGVR